MSSPPVPKKGPKQVLDDVLSRFGRYDLTNKVNRRGEALARGGYYDVYQGHLGSGGKLVAIRQLQHYLNDGEDIAKAIAQEIRIWSHLKHPNILPFLGYTTKYGAFPACVSEWMTNGTAEEYLRREPSANYRSVVYGAAKGLQYLHSQKVIHSDLKAANVLISNTGEALLADFGVSRHLQLSHSILTTKDHTGSLRWMAIESIKCDIHNEEGDNGPRPANQDTDIWALGLTILEITTGSVPYSYIKTEGGIIYAILEQKPPFKSKLSRDGSNVDEQLWKICHQCIVVDPCGRPSVDAIVSVLNVLATAASTHAKNHTLACNDILAEVPMSGYQTAGFSQDLADDFTVSDDDDDDDFTEDLPTDDSRRSRAKTRSASALTLLIGGILDEEVEASKHMCNAEIANRRRKGRISGQSAERKRDNGKYHTGE